MEQKELPVVNKLGLHARASAKLCQLASRFESDIWLTRQQRRVNAKSILGVMTLAAGMGTQVMVEAEGKDETEAVAALAALFADRFGEGQ